MATVARDDDLLRVVISTNYPKWLNDLTDEEFDNVMTKAKDNLIVAFDGEIKRAERFWRKRRKAELEGQTNIYDYV